MSIRTGDEEELAPCLKKLVPAMQQADVDYFKEPATANATIIDLVTKYNNDWDYDQETADFSAEQYTALKLVANGPSGYIGEMTTDRVQKVIDIDTPILTDGGTAPKSGITPGDLFTNEYLDTSIKF